jgi:AcrR family transcriptional regulator
VILPRNRRRIPREERATELLAAATRLFQARGYAGTTMADISAAAGVARGNVYWYFDSKDEIFAAVMDHLLEQEVRALDREARNRDPMTMLDRGLADMQPLRPLHRAMHERLEHSRTVWEAHERFLRWVRTTVGAALEGQRCPADREMTTELAVALFEGANVCQAPQRPVRELIRFLLESALDAPD